MKEQLKINYRYQRKEDMSNKGTLNIILQEDGDVIVSVLGDDGTGNFRSATIEFCMPFSGGGRSTHTRKALIDLIYAIEKDNKEKPIED